MKKKLIIGLYLLTIFSYLQAHAYGEWIKTPITDRWNDKTGELYIQPQLGADSENKYTCAFTFCCETEFENISFIIASSIVTDFASWHPGRAYYPTEISIKFRENEKITTFIGKSFPADSNYDLVAIAVNHSDAIKITKLLKENKTWDVLIEGKNWYNKTKVNGNLPFNFDEKNALLISDDGKTVKGIKTWAKNSIKNIIIPDGIKKITEKAFYDCTELESISIPNSVTDIEAYAFCRCQKLKSIVLPKSIKKIKESTFKGCAELKTVSIPNTVTEIEEDSFSDCKKIKVINFPSSIVKIEKHAFYNCTSLESIFFENESTKIETDAFRNCKNLKKINLRNYFIQNEFLISENTIVSILNYDLENCIIPKNTSIDWQLLYSCRNIKSIEISKPSKINEIDFNECFSYFVLENLESITIPKSVKLLHVPTSVKIIRK